MIYGNHETGRIELREVPFGRFMEMEEWFQDPELHQVAARYDQYDPLRLYRRVFCARDLLVWDIFVDGGENSVGYATLFHNVPADPSMYVYFFDADFDDKVAQEVTMLIVHQIFQNTDAKGLDYILPVVGDDDDPFIRFLVQSGFDRSEETTDVDTTSESCFTLYRHTYDAYFGEGAKDRQTD